MRLPRDIGGVELARALVKVDYQIARQSGSHIRLSHPGPPQHHVTIPAHAPLRMGTLAAILGEVAAHLGVSRDELLGQIFR